jgi:hypothetical protein
MRGGGRMKILLLILFSPLVSKYNFIQMDIDKLREISEYLEKEFICKACATLSTAQEIDILPKVHSNGKIQYSARCPDCGKHIAWMRQNKVPLFFFSKKVGMIQAPDLDLGTLEWLLSVNHKALRAPDVLQSVQEALIDKQGQRMREKADFQLTQEEDREERAKSSPNEVLGLILELKEEQRTLTLRTVEMSASEVDFAIKRLKDIAKELKRLEAARDKAMSDD